MCFLFVFFFADADWHQSFKGTVLGENAIFFLTQMEMKRNTSQSGIVILISLSARQPIGIFPNMSN